MATDFSPASEAAFEEAARMAREWGARLYLLHAYDDAGRRSGCLPAGERLTSRPSRRLAPGAEQRLAGP